MSKKAKEQALERMVWDKPTGLSMTYPDGTVVISGEVVKAGPRAVVKDGKLVRMKPEKKGQD